jgi:hypothetical protein
MIDYVLPHGGPRADSAAPLTETGIAHNASFDGAVALGHEMVPKHFVHESFFGLAFDVDQQASHRG